jgi:hypothetical protein
VASNGDLSKKVISAMRVVSSLPTFIFLSRYDSPPNQVLRIVIW